MFLRCAEPSVSLGWLRFVAAGTTAWPVLGAIGPTSSAIAWLGVVDGASVYEYRKKYCRNLLFLAYFSGILFLRRVGPCAVGVDTPSGHTFA